MKIITNQRKKYLEGRKAALAEKLRHIDFQMEKCVANGDVAEYMVLRQEYTHIRYQIDSINCRLHNLTSQKKFYVEERGMSSHFIVNI